MLELLLVSLSLAGDGPALTPFPGNPVIKGHNIFAPEMIHIDGRWRCYYGGWQEEGQLNDRVYAVESEGADPAGPYGPPRLLVENGHYQLLNDPTIARGKDGAWYMLYTVAFVNLDPFSFDEWIACSTSKDGLTWTPDKGSPETKITITDPKNLAEGTLTGLARPSLVRDGDTWRLWFDGDSDKARVPRSYLAVAKGPKPENFEVVKCYPSEPTGFATFWEPDVAKRPDGSYLAVRQTHFTKVLLGKSTDGENFTWREAVGVDHPDYGRERISNPGLVYDPEADKLFGVVFGMCGPSLMDHDIGLATLPADGD